MSDFDNVVPDWDDVPEDDDAEPVDLMVAHEATPEQVDEALEEAQDSDDGQDSKEEDSSESDFVPVDRAGNPLDDETEEDEA